MAVVRATVVAAILASLLNAGLWALARAVGVSFAVQPPGQLAQEVTVGRVVLLTVVPILLGGAVYSFLRRRLRRAFLVFPLMSLGIFLLLLVPPFAATERAGTRFVLILMHVVAVAALLGLLAQAERQRARL